MLAWPVYHNSVAFDVIAGAWEPPDFTSATVPLARQNARS